MADKRISVTYERPHITFRRVGVNEFVIESNCLPILGGTFELPIGEAAILDLPGKPGNEPPLWINESEYPICST